MDFLSLEIPNAVTTTSSSLSEEILKETFSEFPLTVLSSEA